MPFEAQGQPARRPFGPPRRAQDKPAVPIRSEFRLSSFGLGLAGLGFAGSSPLRGCFGLEANFQSADFTRLGLGRLLCFQLVRCHF